MTLSVAHSQRCNDIFESRIALEDPEQNNAY